MIGLSFVKNNISTDRESGLLYGLQSMNMKKGNYVIGKFLSNLSVLTVMWLFVILGAALMLPFRFPAQPLPFYDFISPFIGIYPGIVFASAFAVLLESVPFISSKAGNAVGLTALFVMFLVNYSASGYSNPLLSAFDYGNYRWVMDSINNAVIPIIGREVRETGILVPGGMFAGSKGGQELVFHGLLWNWQYLIDKIILTAISMALILSAVILLETAEKNKKASSRSLREKGRKIHLLYKPIHDGAQASLKKPAQKLPCDKCGTVDIQHFCFAPICARLPVDHHADLFSGLVFTDGMPGA